MNAVSNISGQQPGAGSPPAFQSEAKEALSKNPYPRTQEPTEFECAKFLFFFALGYGARLLRPVFGRPGAWRVLDGVIGVVMCTIAATLAAGAPA